MLLLAVVSPVQAEPRNVRRGDKLQNGPNCCRTGDIIVLTFPGGSVSKNYLAGGPASRYPAGNLMTGAFEARVRDAAGGAGSGPVTSSGAR